MDVTWCFYACEEVDQRFNGLRAAVGGASRPAGGDAAILGRADRRAGGGRLPGHAAGPDRPRGERGPTPPAPTPGATPSTGLAPLLAAVAGYRRPAAGPRRLRVRRAAPGRRGDRRGGRQRGARRGHGLVNHRFAPDRTVTEAEASVRELLRRTSRRPTTGSWSSGSGSTALARTSGAGRPGRRHRRPAPGQAGVDRRGHVLGARHPGGQLRPGRSPAAHTPGRARPRRPGRRGGRHVECPARGRPVRCRLRG